MNKKRICILMFSICLSMVSFAQNNNDSISTEESTKTMIRGSDKATLGLGAGLDYGGIGANMLFYSGENNAIGFFGGLGYALSGVGFNAGIKARLISKTDFPLFNPYLLAMYGYNTVIKISNAPSLNKIFYGATLGIGVDIRPNNNGKGYWTLAVLVPIRNSNVDDYIEFIKNNHGIGFKNELSPIAVSIGYRIKLNQ